MTSKLSQIFIESRGTNAPLWTPLHQSMTSVYDFICSMPKSCELDPVPMSLLQEVIDDLLPFLTALCNSSIREASLPDSQKRSILLPVIKQDGLDQSDPANYRPMILSYLKF